MSDTNYSRNDFINISNTWIDLLTDKKDVVSTSNPRAFLLGGQAGAGKTTLHRYISEELNDNVIVIDNDSFKQSHPNLDQLIQKYGKNYIEKVTPFSNELTEYLINRLSDLKYNLIIEGTLRTTETPIKTAELLKQKKYEVNLYVMAVSKELSSLAIDKRYEEGYSKNPDTARHTPKDIHDTIVNNLPDNIETLYEKQIFKDIKLINRQGEELYQMNETPLKSPKNALKNELDRKLAKEEYLNEVNHILALAKINDRLDDPSIKNLLKKKERLTEKEKSDLFCIDSVKKIDSHITKNNHNKDKNKDKKLEK